jgi:hypothetical protein
MPFSTICNRSLLLTKPLQRSNQVRQFSSLLRSKQSEQQRCVHNTPQNGASVGAAVDLPKIETKEENATSSLISLRKRFLVTGEVIVSKIFPAGFGWQSSSILAENHLGFATDTVSFALTTGFGDAAGVLLGHCGYYGLKKTITGDKNILMERELDTGILLASAAFCSGSLWQPIVDVLQGADLSFSSVFVGTWIGCGTAFYAGLRAGRTVLPNILQNIEEPTYENSKTDASLSLAIGGATGFFVGTDAVYLPEQNFLLDIIGIQDGTPDLTGCAIAGSSTALGFGVAQSGLNIIYPSGKCWND